MSLDEAVLEHSDASQLPTGPIPPQPRSRIGSLFFSGSPTDQQIAEEAAFHEETNRQLDGDGSASGDEWQSDPDESLSETSSPGSSGEPGGPLKPLGKAALKATSRKGVLIATSAVHRVAARHELERAAGLYIADEQDQELIGDPIAELLHRRGGIVGDKMSPDANDAISALMGLANYIGKQVALTVEIGQLKAAGVQVQAHRADGEVA